MSFQQCFNYIAEKFGLLVGGGIRRENNRHADSYKSNRKVVTNGAGTAYPSGAPKFTLVEFVLLNIWSSVWCVVDHCLTLFFGHQVVCPSSIYGFWLSLWYLQTFLTCSWQ